MKCTTILFVEISSYLACMSRASLIWYVWFLIRTYLSSFLVSVSGVLPFSSLLPQHYWLLLSLPTPLLQRWNLPVCGTWTLIHPLVGLSKSIKLLSMGVWSLSSSLSTQEPCEGVTQEVIFALQFQPFPLMAYFKVEAGD